MSNRYNKKNWENLGSFLSNWYLDILSVSLIGLLSVSITICSRVSGITWCEIKMLLLIFQNFEDGGEKATRLFIYLFSCAFGWRPSREIIFAQSCINKQVFRGKKPNFTFSTKGSWTNKSQMWPPYIIATAVLKFDFSWWVEWLDY